MSDEQTTTETIEPTEPTPVEEEAAAPSVSEDAIKAYLSEQGIDLDKAKKLTEWEKDVQRKSSEAGRLEKKLQEIDDKLTPKEPEPEFDPDELETLKKALKTTGIDPEGIRQMQEYLAAERAAQIDDVADSFFESHKDFSQEAVIKQLIENGVDTESITPRQLKRELDKAHRELKADPDYIEREVERRLAEKAKALEPTSDEEVVSIRRGPATSGGLKSAADIANDSDLTMFERMQILMQGGPQGIE